MDESYSYDNQMQLVNLFNILSAKSTQMEIVLTATSSPEFARLAKGISQIGIYNDLGEYDPKVYGAKAVTNLVRDLDLFKGISEEEEIIPFRSCNFNGGGLPWEIRNELINWNSIYSREVLEGELHPRISEISGIDRLARGHMIYRVQGKDVKGLEGFEVFRRAVNESVPGKRQISYLYLDLNPHVVGSEYAEHEVSDAEISAQNGVILFKSKNGKLIHNFFDPERIGLIIGSERGERYCNYKGKFLIFR